MEQHVLSELEFSKRVAKRAQYEAMEFTLVGENVRVRNASHEHPDEHEYLVTVDDGIPTTCECPADEHYEGACKHRVAVGIRKPVLDATSQRRVATDGGAKAKQHTDDRGDVECSCVDLTDDFPCWECVKTGRQDRPE